MSTKTLRKRIALVAVSALGFGLLSVVPSSAAGTGVAATTTGSAITGTVSPVRVTFGTETTATELDTVPYAKISWIAPHSLATADTAIMTLTSAPSTLAFVQMRSNTNIGTAVSNGFFTTKATNQGASLATPSLSDTTAIPVTSAACSYLTTDDCTASVAIAANVAGYYAGTIKYNNTAGGMDTISFSFTTRGAVASVTATTSAATVDPSGTVTISTTLKDAAANVTQPTVNESVSLAKSGTGASLITAITTTGSGASSLFDGVATATYTATATASLVGTVTATPAGLIGALAASAVTVTNTATAIATGAITNFTVSAPSDRTTLAGTAPDRTTTVRGGTSAVTFGFTAAAAGTYRFRVTATGASATVNGVAVTDAQSSVGTSQFVTGTTGTVSTTTSVATGSASFTLGGGAILTGSIITVTAVNSVDGLTGGTLILTSVAANATPAKYTSVPTGSMVKTIGATTSIDVTIKDPFNVALGSGITVRAYRGSVVPANLLGSATTNSSGVATLSVTSATAITTGTAESYIFTSEGGGTADTAGATLATITYTTTGTITSNSTAMNNTAVTAIVNNEATAWAAQTIYPVINTPGNDGLADSVTGLSGKYTVLTGLVTGTTGAELLTLTTTNTPGNTTVWTSDSGAYLSATAAPTAAAVLQTLEVANATAVYAYAKTVGLHTFTATSGGKTTTVKVWAINAPTDYYTMSASAASTSVVTGGNTVVTMTLKDMHGNVVDAADALVTATASGSVRLAGQALTSTLNTTALGVISFTVVGDAAAGTGTITLAPTGTGAEAWASDFEAVTGASAPVQTVTLTFTVTASTVKTVDQLSTELAAVSAALTAKIAADAAADAAAATAATAAAATAATAAAAAKVVADAAAAATAAAIAAVLEAATAATDAATEAIDNGASATDSANIAAESADAATAAAQDAADLASEAGSIAQTAADTAAEALEAANAATDAANAAAESADAATSAALDAVDAANSATAAANAASDAVAALATQMATALSGIKAQITALTNLIVKIQKKVKA